MNSKNVSSKSNFLERFFQISEKGSSVKTEIIAGVVTFMAMAYCLAVHPSFMAAAGMDAGAVTTAVALFCGLCSIAMGLYTNLPYAMGPAMGTNAFFAYTLVVGGVVNWQTAMGMVFISGVVFILLTLLGLREMIVKMIPVNVKIAIGAAIGLFIAQLVFSSGGLMVINDGRIGFGDVYAPATQLTIIGLIIIMAFKARESKLTLLITIAGVTLLGIPFGVTKLPESLITAPPSIAPISFELDIMAALKFSFFSFIFTFFVGDFFSTLGTLLGVSEKAGFLDENGNLKDIHKPFWVDSVSTTVCSLFGLTTMTTYLESAAGVEAGGRTGLTAIVTGICFFLCLFFVPVALMIPASATAPVLIFIGILMLSSVEKLNFNDPTEFLPAAFTIVFCAYTFSIANGISVGILSYVAIKLLSGRYRELHPGLYFLSVPLIYFFMI